MKDIVGCDEAPDGHMHIRAKDEVVPLSDILETEPQKAPTGKAAESVSGMKKVNNVIPVSTLPFRKEQVSLLKENRAGLRGVKNLCLRRKEWQMRITRRNAITSFTQEQSL